MKVASRVFLIIGLVESILVMIYSLFLIPPYNVLYLFYGLYGLVTSILGLIFLNGFSKTRINVIATLYIPVILLASIFMYCIKAEDLF